METYLGVFFTEIFVQVSISYDAQLGNLYWRHCVLHKNLKKKLKAVVIFTKCENHEYFISYFTYYGSKCIDNLRDMITIYL